jgi:D-alanyl-D-alanine carboxypeptidase (penicillin-binding protein 5/6)
VAEQYRDDPKTIIQSNHNRLLQDTPGVDGLKTGYIDEAGYNIALTAERGGTRLVAVILGAPASFGGDRIRDQDGRALLDWGFRHFKTLRVTLPPLPVPRIWKGDRPVSPVLPRDTGAGGILTGEGGPEAPGLLTFTAYANRGSALRWEWDIPDPLIAPFPAESVLGNLCLYDDTGELRRIALVCPEAIPAGNLWRRIRDSLGLFFRKHSLGPKEG